MSKLVKEVGTRSDLIALSEAKAWLRVTRDNEDALILSLLEASILWAEGVCKRVFAYQSYELYVDSFSNIVLPNAPIDEIESIEYIAYGETEYTLLDDSKYQLNPTGIEGALDWMDSTYSFPSLADRFDAIKVSYTAGFEILPENVKTAILLKLNSLYDNRVDENKRFATTAEYLLTPYKIYSLI